MKKKCKVVMLPANEKANTLALYTPDKHDVVREVLNISNHNQRLYGGEPDCQHLYILSDDEIKEGDWCLDTLHNDVFQFGVFRGSSNSNKKIIATTDKSIQQSEPDGIGGSTSWFYPSLSENFIEKYVEEYNKGNVITEVLVEYDMGPHPEWTPDYNNPDNPPVITYPKINPENNTIRIYLQKQNYTREEVIEIMLKFKKDTELYSFTEFSKKYGDALTVPQMERKWIEQYL